MAFTKYDIVLNLFWKFAERCGSQGISFVVTVFLARILVPEDYGLVALVQIFLTILSVFVDNGMGVALIQKKDADELDFSSVFILNTFIGVILYVALWLCAPYIERFYSVTELTVLIRVMGITLIIAAWRSVQQAYISRKMKFKCYFYATLVSSALSAVVGIGMAIEGVGVWALVAQQLINNIAGVIVVDKIISWRPSMNFSFRRVAGLFSYGWKLLLSAVLDTGYNQLWQLLIGKFYSPSDLAYFNQGQKFPSLIVTNINASIDSILLPVMSNVQEDHNRVKEMTRHAMETSIFIMAPIMMIMAFSAENIVMLVLTDKWLPCVPFFVVYCIIYMFYPLHTANLNAIKALGRSDLFLGMEVIKKIVGIAVLLYTMQYGLLVMAYGLLVMSGISQLVNSWPNHKLLKYGYFQQMRDILPAIILAVMAGGIVWLIGRVELPLAMVIFFQVVAGGVAYISMAWLFKLKSLRYVYEVFLKMKNKNEGIE